MLVGRMEILGTGADRAAGLGNHAGGFVIGPGPEIAPVLPIGDKGDGLDMASLCLDPRPARRVGTRNHLAPPKRPEIVHFRGRIELQRHAATHAAAIEGEHQARCRIRAAKALDDQAEAPVIAPQYAHFGCHMGEGRFPEQGAIGEDPDRLASRPFGQGGFQRRLALGIGQPAQADPIGFAQFGPIVDSKGWGAIGCHGHQCNQSLALKQRAESLTLQVI